MAFRKIMEHFVNPKLFKNFKCTGGIQSAAPSTRSTIPATVHRGFVNQARGIQSAKPFTRSTIPATVYRGFVNQARVGGFTRPSASLVLSGFVGSLLWQAIQAKHVHVQVNNQIPGSSRTTSIEDDEPNYPIVCELRLIIRHIPYSDEPIKVDVHGLWMGYVDDSGVVHLINFQPSPDDFSKAREALRAATTAGIKPEMDVCWPSSGGRKRDFWLDKFVKHALTAFGVYKTNYFVDAISAARPYIGGNKDLAVFLKKYPAAVEHNKTKFNSELNSYIGANVRVLCPSTGPRYLDEIGILFTRDMILTDHPGSCVHGNDLVVRRYKGNSEP